MLVHEPRFTVLGFLLLVAVATGADDPRQALARSDEPKSSSTGQPSPVAGHRSDANPDPAPGRMFVVGRVLDPEGQAVPGATVVVFARNLAIKHPPYLVQQIPIADARADRSGRFRIDAPRTSSWRHLNLGAIALAPGYGVGWVELDPDDDQPAGDISLGPEQVIHGRLFDLQGRPVPDVTLSVYRMSHERPQAPAGARPRFDGVFWGPRSARGIPAWPMPVTTDPEGRFTLRGMGRDLRADLTVRHPRFALQNVQVETDGASESKTVTAALAPSQIINVRVTYADTGQPVAHAPLRVMASRGRVSTGDESETDTDGRARINSWPADRTYGIMAFPPEGQPYLTARGRIEWPKGALEQSLELALPRGVLITGKVTEEGSGEPIPGASVGFVPRGERPSLFNGDIQVNTASDGSFRLGAEPSPGYLFIKGPSDDYVLEEIGSRLVAQGQAGGTRIHAHAHFGLDLKPGIVPKEVHLALRRGVTVTGQAVGPDGQLVQDASIISRIVLGPAYEIPWAPWGRTHGKVRKGRFELHGVDPDVETPVYFLDPRRKLGAAVNLSSKSIALMTMANRAGGIAPGAMIAFSDKSMVRGPITVKLDPCGAARARLVDPEGKPVAGRLLPRDVSITMVVTPGPTYSRAPDQAGLLVAEETDLNQVDSINYPNELVADAEGRLTLPVLIPGATYRVIDYSMGRQAVPQVRKEFTIKSGETLDLGEILIGKPSR
jgi:hypothetical protein